MSAATALTPVAFKGLIGDAAAAVQPPPVGLASRSIETPTVEELNRIARHYFMDMSPKDLEEYRELIGGFLGSFPPPRRIPRTTASGLRPLPGVKGGGAPSLGSQKSNGYVKLAPVRVSANVLATRWRVTNHGPPTSFAGGRSCTRVGSRKRDYFFVRTPQYRVSDHTASHIRPGDVA